MKKLILLLPLIALGFGPCATAPTAAEQKLFTIITNYLDVPRFVLFTNWHTNIVIEARTITNTEHVIIPYAVTNLIPYPMPTLVTVTDHVPQYDYQPGKGEQQIKDAASGVGSIVNPAVGGPIGGALAGLVFGLWRSIRSSRKATEAGGNAVQIIEVMREFVKTLPNGAAYDRVLTQFMANHQMEAGVVQQVMKLLESHVTSGGAKEGLAELQKTLAALQVPVPSPTSPLTPKTG